MNLSISQRDRSGIRSRQSFAVPPGRRQPQSRGDCNRGSVTSEKGEVWQSAAGLGFLSLALLPQAAVGADYRFPAHGGDLPAGVYWRITGHKAPSKARDLSGVRFDSGPGKWTAWKPGA